MTSYKGRKPRKPKPRKARSFKIRPIDTGVISTYDGKSRTTVNVATIAGYDTKSGASDPKWEEKVKNRQDATLPYSRLIMPDKRGFSNSPVSWQWKISRYYPPRTKELHTANLVGYVGANNLAVAVRNWKPTLVTDRIRSECKLAFLSKVREITTPWSGGVFLGELKELVSGIKGLGGRIFNQSLSFRSRARHQARLYRRKPARLLADLEDMYLSWTYGVAPLLGDVGSYYQAVQQLYHNAVEVPVIVTIPAENLVKGVSYKYSGASGSIQVRGVGWMEARASVRIVGSVKSQISGPMLEKALSLGGFQLTDFVPTLYELLPYSFLVDYFSSMGDVVNGYFTDTRGLVYCSQTERLTVKGLGTYFGAPSQVGYFKCVQFPVIPSVRKISKLSLNRSKANLSVSLKDIHLTMPNTKQWFNTAVLGLSKMRRDDASF
jgi:hypothetical protein